VIVVIELQVAPPSDDVKYRRDDWKASLIGTTTVPSGRTSG
jgi:hypothetical protein